MATPLQTSNTIDFNSARLSLSKPQQTPLSESVREDYSERRYRMASSLQTTLDIEQLLVLFLAELKPSVELDGLQYINENQRLQTVTGRKASHSCGYRLITANDHLGEIVFYRNTRFSDQNLQAIEVMLSALICPLRNALSYREAVMASLSDPLTGAGNRIALNNALEREINLARRFKQPLSILVMDIDKFKYANDTYGHSAGDAVLKQFVGIINKINRNADVTATIAKQATHSCGYRLITNEDNLGEIIFKRGKKFTEKELSILETLLSPLIHPLRNALRFNAAVKAAFADPVTGVGNKVHLLGNLAREIDLAKRHNQALSVLMIEVDSLGKSASKALLKQSKLAITDLAQRIVKLSRTTDGVFRCEPGIFMAILSNTDRAGAHVMAKRISDSAHDLVLVEDNQDVQKLTLSVGMAVLTGTDSSASLIDRAGKALNNAKKRGGNLIHS